MSAAELINSVNRLTEKQSAERGLGMESSAGVTEMTLLAKANNGLS